MLTPAEARASRIKVLLMFLLPIMAVGLASLVFYTGVGIPGSTTNRGELLQPPRQIDDIRLVSGAGAEAWRYADGEPGWALLVVNRGPCAESCRERLYLTRQIRTAMGREEERIARLLLQVDGSAGGDFPAFAAEAHPDLRILGTSAAEVSRLFGEPGGPDPFADRPVYVVDPGGFLMMYYLPSHSGRDTIADLRFLLKHSYEKVR